MYLGTSGDDPTPLCVRVLKRTHDGRAFMREVQRAIAYGGPAAPQGVEEIDHEILAWGPLIQGESLATILDGLFAESTPMPVEQAIAIAMGIGERLGKGARRIHGDLTPHHVLIGYDGTVALIDPAGVEEAIERAGAPGRESYRSPEHVKGTPVSAASDVFVLGTLLYELTTATRLFAGATPKDTDTAILAGGYPRPRAVLGDHYPIELQVLLRKLLRAQPEGRFPDGEAALEGLRLAASVRAEGQAARVGEWMRARFSERLAAWVESMTAISRSAATDFDLDQTDEHAELSPAPASRMGDMGAPWPAWAPPAPPSPSKAALSAARPKSVLPSPIGLRGPGAIPIADLDGDEKTGRVDLPELMVLDSSAPLTSRALAALERQNTAIDFNAEAASRADTTDPHARAFSGGIRGRTLEDLSLIHI